MAPIRFAFFSLQRNEKGKSSAEAHLSNQPKEKAILIDRSSPLEVLTSQPTFSESTGVLLVDTVRTALKIQFTQFNYSQVEVDGRER